MNDNRTLAQKVESIVEHFNKYKNPQWKTSDQSLRNMCWEFINTKAKKFKNDKHVALFYFGCEVGQICGLYQAGKLPKDYIFTLQLRHNLGLSIVRPLRK